VRPEGLSLKYSNDPIGNRILVLPDFTAVSQPTAPTAYTTELPVLINSEAIWKPLLSWTRWKREISLLIEGSRNPNPLSSSPSYASSKKGKGFILQAWTGPEGSRKLRLLGFKTIGT
jgi:hypothetical protein